MANAYAGQMTKRYATFRLDPVADCFASSQEHRFCLAHTFLLLPSLDSCKNLKSGT